MHINSKAIQQVIGIKIFTNFEFKVIGDKHFHSFHSHFFTSFFNFDSVMLLGFLLYFVIKNFKNTQFC